MTTTLEDTPAAGLAARQLTLGYGDHAISRDLDLRIPPGSFTVVVGPNACGKSTLLRGLSRLLTPTAGEVVLDGRTLAGHPTRELARRLGLLAQTSVAPEGITVANLVARGRFPHQGLFHQWSDADEDAVLRALGRTDTLQLSDRRVGDLSGGQQQRVWVAMALAQETPYLLLDEPTTFLDIAHQVELMELFSELHAEGRTLVAVLHDLNQAARYGSHLIAMRDGAVVAAGPPADVVTEELVEDVFDLPVRILTDPTAGTPVVVPVGRRVMSR